MSLVTCVMVRDHTDVNMYKSIHVIMAITLLCMFVLGLQEVMNFCFRQLMSSAVCFKK